MCGITGILSFKNNIIDRCMVKKALNCLSHRGPNDSGLFCEENIALGHHRLSILDLTEAGHQPMLTDDNRYVIVFNGEIYNFPEIRKTLERTGYSFKGHSDTEVALQAFAAWGKDCFIRFNGMFAIAIYDRHERKLTIARDRFGIKPLYYFNDGNLFVFASEIKAILATGLPSRKVNYQGLSEYIWYGNAMGGNTLFADIKELLPGSLLEMDKTGLNHSLFYNVNDIVEKNEKEEGAIVNVRHLLEEAVKRHLISDVPVGVFLSGGIDSSAITALASRYYAGKLQTYSVGFDFDKGVNELPKAAAIAREFKTDHHELHIKADDLIPIIENLVTCHDEPFADAANIPLFLLSKEIKGSIKVVLQGDGGDEVFGGYSRYNTTQHPIKWQTLATFFNLVPQSVRHPSVLRLRRFFDAISSKDPATRNALLLTMETRRLPPERIFSKPLQEKLNMLNPFHRYEEVYASLSGASPIEKVFLTDTRIILPDTFLEKVDKSTMANSLEVRVPFLDTALTDYVLPLSGRLKVKGGEKKYLLKKALRGTVPDSILDAPKTGFGVPYSFWLKGTLNTYLRERINETKTSGMQLFNYPLMETMISQHAEGKGYNGFLLWKSLQLAIWANEYKVIF